MSSLNQIIRNLFIRIEALISVFFKQIFSLFANIFGLFAKIFGFSQSEYYLESNQPQSVKDEQKQLPKTESVKAKEISVTNRRPKTKMDDYYLNMAKELKKN